MHPLWQTSGGKYLLLKEILVSDAEGTGSSCRYHQKCIHSSPSTSPGRTSSSGLRLTKRMELPLARVREIRWIKCLFNICLFEQNWIQSCEGKFHFLGQFSATGFNVNWRLNGVWLAKEVRVDQRVFELGKPQQSGYTLATIPATNLIFFSEEISPLLVHNCLIFHPNQGNLYWPRFQRDYERCSYNRLHKQMSTNIICSTSMVTYQL